MAEAVSDTGILTIDLNSIPGMTYEPLPLTRRQTTTYGELLADTAIRAPFATVGRFQPTNPVAWLVRNTVLAIVMMAWLLTFCLPLLSIGVPLALFSPN